jgi:glycosyltransferase involved in cell wall biosynthesis
VSLALVLGSASGGMLRHVAMLADGCSRAGLATAVFGPANGRSVLCGQETDGRPAVSFQPVQISEAPRPARDLAALTKLRMLLRRYRPDVVHAHGLRAGALAALAMSASPQPRRGAVAHQRRSRRPALVVTVHNAPPAGWLARLAYRVLERICVWRADMVLTVSADLADRMRALGAVATGRAVVAAPDYREPDPAATGRARAALGGGARPVVLAAARLGRQKGLDLLIAAAASWQHRAPRPLLAIAGTGPLAGRLAALAASSGVDVTFLGWREDIPALLSAADVVVVPSTWEGQPLIVQEALQAGRPIVAARVGGISELTRPGSVPARRDDSADPGVLAGGGDPADPGVLPGGGDPAGPGVLPGGDDSLDPRALPAADDRLRPRVLPRGDDPPDPSVLLVPPGDPTALARAVLRVLDDPRLAARLAAAARAQAGRLPTAADAVASAIGVYRLLCR